MSRSLALVLIALLPGCRSAGEPKVAPSAKQVSAPYPEGSEPNWVAESLFSDPSEGVTYAVGQQSIGEGPLAACPKDTLLLKKAEAAARERMVAAGVAGSEARSAEVRYALFDGLGTLFVVAGLRAEAPEGTKHLAPKGGAGGPATIEAARAALALEVARSGVCDDPHRRAELPCCGSASTFCSDPERFDQRNADGTCACGADTPCLHDFRCETRQGQKKCICRGERCPCAAMIKCKPGQTCEDGRCF